MSEVAPKRPDLQQLVARYGSYSAIPTEEWKQWDREVEAWKAWIRSGQRHYDREKGGAG